MNCLTAIFLAARIASAEPGVFVGNECGLEAGIYESDGRAAVEVAAIIRREGFPVYVRPTLRYRRERVEEFEPVLIEQTGEPQRAQIHSTVRVPLVVVEGGEAFRNEFSPTVSFGVEARASSAVSFRFEFNPIDRTAHGLAVIKF